MSKLLVTVAVTGVLAIAAFSPAAADQRADGLRNAGIEQLEVSDRRRYRHVRRWGYYRPYYAYAPRYYYARPYYRPYYRPYRYW